METFMGTPGETPRGHPRRKQSQTEGHKSTTGQLHFLRLHWASRRLVQCGKPCCAFRPADGFRARLAQISGFRGWRCTTVRAARETLKDASSWRERRTPKCTTTPSRTDAPDRCPRVRSTWRISTLHLRGILCSFPIRRSSTGTQVDCRCRAAQTSITGAVHE
jgi:hypothetical protein